MFKAAKGLAALLYSLVALAAAAQEGLRPDQNRSADPLIYAGIQDSQDDREFWTTPGFLLSPPAWENQRYEDQVESRLNAWLRQQLEARLPQPETRTLLAEIKSANLLYLYQTDAAGSIEVDACGKPLLRKTDGLWGESGDHAGWNTRITATIETLLERWNREAGLICQEILQALPADLADRGEEKLFISLAAYKQSVEREFERLFRQEESLFLYARLQDAASLREQSEARTAMAMTRAIIQDTDTALADMKAALDIDLSRPVQPRQTLSAETELSVQDWQEGFHENFQSALKVWRLAESRLIEERIRWERDAENSFLEGEKAWDSAFSEFRGARRGWLEEFALLAEEGTKAWLEQEEILLAGCQKMSAELLAAAEREAASMEIEIEGLLSDYRRSRNLTALADGSIAGLRQQIDRTTDTTQRALCEEEMAYWESIRSQYGQRSESILRDLTSLEEEILTDDGLPFGDSYTRELGRLQAKVELLLRQVDIAEAVVRYAECRTSDRPTQAETADACEQAKQFFADAEKDYLAALDRLEQSDRRLIEAEAMLALLKNDIDAAREALAEAEEACELANSFTLAGDAALFEDLIGGELALLRSYYSAERQALYERYFYFWEKTLRNELRQEAEDLLNRTQQGAAGTDGLGELEERLCRVLELQLDYSLPPEGLATRLQLAGIGPGTQYADELLAAYDVCFQEDAFPGAASLAALRAGYYLEKLKEDARLELARSLAAIELLQSEEPADPAAALDDLAAAAARAEWEYHYQKALLEKQALQALLSPESEPSQPGARLGEAFTLYGNVSQADLESRIHDLEDICERLGALQRGETVPRDRVLVDFLQGRDAFTLDGFNYADCFLLAEADARNRARVVRSVTADLADLAPCFFSSSRAAELDTLQDLLGSGDSAADWESFSRLDELQGLLASLFPLHLPAYLLEMIRGSLAFRVSEPLPDPGALLAAAGGELAALEQREALLRSGSPGTLEQAGLACLQGLPGGEQYLVAALAVAVSSAQAQGLDFGTAFSRSLEQSGVRDFPAGPVIEYIEKLNLAPEVSTTADGFVFLLDGTIEDYISRRHGEADLYQQAVLAEEFLNPGATRLGMQESINRRYIESLLKTFRLRQDDLSRDIFALTQIRQIAGLTREREVRVDDDTLISDEEEAYRRYFSLALEEFGAAGFDPTVTRDAAAAAAAQLRSAAEEAAEIRDRIADYQEALTSWRQDSEAYTVETLRPLAARLEECRTRYDQSQAVYHDQLASLENLAAAYTMERESADSAYRAYREAGYRLQEAEEITDYALSGSVSGGIAPQKILDRRRTEYQRTRRALDLLTSLYQAGEREKPFAARNPRYTALKQEQLRLSGLQILLSHARDQLQVRVLEIRQSSAEALAKLGSRISGLVDLGDTGFSVDVDTLAPGIEALTDFSSPDPVTEDMLAGYFSNRDGSFSRDIMIWFTELERLITPGDLTGEGLTYITLQLPAEYQRWLPPGSTELRLPVGLADTGLMGLFKDFSFAYYFETGAVEIAAERQQAYGLLSEEIDADPAAYLRSCGRKSLELLQADPGLRKLYAFFKLLLEKDKLLADTAFMGRDLSFAAVTFLKEEANAAIDAIKKKYPIIHIFMPGKKKRIREYRDSLQLLDGGAGKQLLAREIDCISGWAEAFATREDQLGLLTGKTGMSCPEFILAWGIALGEEIGAETAEYIRSNFPAQAGMPGNGAAEILDTLLQQAAAQCEATNSEIAAVLAELREERAASAASYQRLLGSRDISWQELESVARRLFYNPGFTEEDRLRADQAFAGELYASAPCAELPGLEMRGASLLALFHHKLAVALEQQNAALAQQLESLGERRSEWEEKIAELYAAGMGEWQAGFAVLSGKRGTWEQRFSAEYEEKVSLWDRKYELFEMSRRNWLEESAERGYTAACAAMARELGIEADSLTAGVANIIIPDMSFGAPRLSVLISDITGQKGLADILADTRGSGERIGSRVLFRGPYLPFSGAFRKNSLALERFQSRLDDEIYQKAALVNALRMREIVSMTREEIQALITEANESVGRQIGNTLEAAGYLKQGAGFNRSALIDRSILGGTEKERQFIKGYRYYQAPELDAGADLNRSFLEGLRGELIQVAVKNAVAQLQEYLELIFGRSELEETTGLGAELRVRLQSEKDRFQSSAQYADYTELKGLFAMHVGYAPVMSEDAPEEVALAGYGEYGRIFELFLRNEARLSRGLATLSIPVYDLRLWDDDRDNDGEPDNWFHAPTPRGIVDLGVSIIGTVLLGPGTGMLALSLVDDAVFTGLDVAGGRTSWSEAGLGMSKKALTGLVSQGFASFNAAAMAEMGGAIEGAVAKTIFHGGSQLAENLVSGAIGALQIQGHGLALDPDMLEDSLVGRQALIDVAAGMSGTFVRESLDALNLSDQDMAGFSRLHVDDAAVFNRTLGSLASAAVEFGLGGQSGLNILNLRDFSGQGPEHGLLELHLGTRDTFLNIGAAGHDLSPTRISRSISGFEVQRTNRKIRTFSSNYEEETGYATDIALRAEYSFGDKTGIATLRNILAGSDVLHIGLADAEGMTVRRQDGGRDIHLAAMGDNLSDQLYLAVLLQHEAHRDGVPGADNTLETRDAVTARVRMSERILPDYGDDFILGHDALVKDFIAYEMARSLGRDFWHDYIDESYSSQADFARRILNWQRRGRVGVIPTPDAYGVTDVLFGGFSALARTLHLANGDRRDITEKEPGDFQDYLMGTLSLVSLSASLLSSGLVESFSATSLVDFTFSALSPLPRFPDGSLAGILNFSANISQQLLQAREVMSYVLRDDFEECQKWHAVDDRDKKIFALAEEIGIDLSIPYEETRSEDYYRIVEQQMVNRYIWLGNMIYNDGITDPEDLKMLFYGPYVEVFDEEHGLRQYQKLPGYIDKEYRDFFGMGDHSELGDDFFLKYTANFEMANILHHKSYLSAPVNWSPDYQEDIYEKWERGENNISYYYSYTSYWELRYKNLMLSLEE